MQNTQKLALAPSRMNAAAPKNTARLIHVKIEQFGRASRRRINDEFRILSEEQGIHFAHRKQQGGSFLMHPDFHPHLPGHTCSRSVMLFPG